jgi:hypothetical protein
VPAGSPDGGQWTDGGEGSGDDDLLPEGASPAKYEIDTSRALTGIESVDSTTNALARTLAMVAEFADFTPRSTPQLYGILVHKLFADAVRLQQLRGIGYTDVEQTFGLEPDASYGARFSVRTDVVLRNEGGNIVAIYDVKTGNAELTSARVRQLRARTRVGPNVPIFELHLTRGARVRKSLATGSLIIARFTRTRG